MLTILCHSAPSRNLRHLQGLGECLGARANVAAVDDRNSFEYVTSQAIASGAGALVLDIASLSDACAQSEFVEVVRLLRVHDIPVLLLVTHVEESIDRVLRTFTEGVVQGVQRLECADHVNFPRGRSRLSGELESQSYRRNERQALTLTIETGEAAEVVMSLDATPSFVRVGSGKGSMFVWSTVGVLDALRPVAAELEFEDTADEYIPAIIFLRFVFGDRIWHNPRVGAGFVIDDPLLKRNYGFIDFPLLLRSARQRGYHITLAFIPWNHWRSRKRDVQLFRDYADCFSICAHGCDHTKNEFGISDYDTLVRKNFVAQERMEHHGQRTGLRSEPLMVCPQERYSLEALRAFADSRQFLGLVNTACIPRDLTGRRVCSADLLLPAQDSYFGFPVFKRYYPNQMPALAMALFLGKPAILVEHHEFLRNGLAGVELYISKLAELRPDAEWSSLHQVAIRTHLRLRVSQGRQDVRFFTDTFHMDHETEEPTEYRMQRRLPDDTPVHEVLVNGEEAPFWKDNGYLNFKIQAAKPGTLRIQVGVTASRPTTAYSSGLGYQASVAFRRLLSELRDNVLARNPLALKAASFLVKSMKQAAG